MHAGGLQWLHREGDIRFKGIKADAKYTKRHTSSCVQAVDTIIAGTSDAVRGAELGLSTY